jgi:hypothetical protein
MRLSRLLLSVAGLAILFACIAPGWADKIPTKRPSSYGDETAQVKLTPPSFDSVTVDGVTISLDSVFCNSCQTTPTNLEYFFDINLAPGATLTSLTFDKGFSTSDPLAFGFVQFNPVLASGDFDACSDGTNYLCQIPFTESSLDLTGIGTDLECDDTTGVCTITFTNFNFAAVGNRTVVLGASTDFGIGTKIPFTPNVTINGSLVTVPEPGSAWFAGIGLLACVGMFGLKQRKLRSSVIY